MAEMFLQAQAILVTGAPALQCDVGVQRIVARAHGGVAADPITGDEMCRVRSNGAHPADCPGSGYHRQVQQVFALAAEDFVGIGQHPGCDDIDNDFAGTQHRVGQGLDGKWRSERPEDCSFHDDPAFWRGDHDRRLTAGWNRDGPSALRSPPSMLWLARCGSARRNMLICGPWLGTPTAAPSRAKASPT